MSPIEIAKARAPRARSPARRCRSGSRRRRDGCANSRAGSNRPSRAGSPRRRARGSAGAVARSAGKRSGSRVRSTGAGSPRRHGAGLDQAFVVEQVDHARRDGGRVGLASRRRRLRRLAVRCEQREVEQALRVVVGGAEHLPAGQVLEGGGDAAVELHARGVQRHAGAQARQRGAVGAQQEDGFDQVARRLLDRERGEFGVVDRAFGHHAVDRELELLADLRDRELGRRRVAAALLGQQAIAVEDGGFAALDGNVHAQCLQFDARGARQADDLVRRWRGTGPRRAGRRHVGGALRDQLLRDAPAAGRRPHRRVCCGCPGRAGSSASAVGAVGRARARRSRRWPTGRGRCRCPARSGRARAARRRRRSRRTAPRPDRRRARSRCESAARRRRRCRRARARARACSPGRAAPAAAQPRPR